MSALDCAGVRRAVGGRRFRVRDFPGERALESVRPAGFPRLIRAPACHLGHRTRLCATVLL